MLRRRKKSRRVPSPTRFFPPLPKPAWPPPSDPALRSQADNPAPPADEFNYFRHSDRPLGLSSILDGLESSQHFALSIIRLEIADIGI